jgi:hypothetical protein
MYPWTSFGEYSRDTLDTTSTLFRTSRTLTTRYLRAPGSSSLQIIIRARQNYIWKEYLKSPPQISDIQQKVLESWKVYARKILPQEAVERYEMDQDLMTYIHANATPEAKADEKFNMHINALNSARTGILETHPDTYYEKVKDILLPALDKEVCFLASLSHI